MIVSFRCTPDLKDRVDELVQSGVYDDFSTFCVAAIENQLLLEAEHADGEGVATKLPSKRRARPTARSAAGSASALAMLELASPSSPGGRPNDEAVTEIGVPSLLKRDRLNEKPPFMLPAMFADVFDGADRVPVDRWLFGQYNRIFPVKVSTRALAAIALEGKDALNLSTAGPRIAEAASQVGEYLRMLDRRFGHHRDDALATAFPSAGLEGEKGRLRYQNHFVGHTVKGEQGGMLVGLKLAVIQTVKNKPHILPTSAGWEFAQLANPLLDDHADDPKRRLTEDEAAFLLEHIRANVPAEVFAYRVVLSVIDAGHNTPDSVNERLKAFRSPDRRSNDDDDFLATQRNGALGRMTDLGLVGRERQATRVSYRLTEEGRTFLHKVGAVPVGRE